MKPAGAIYKEPVPIDPARFGDPVALKTSWEPGWDGSNVCTHRLVKVGPDKMMFRLTTQLKVIYSVLLLSGIIILLYALSGHLSAFSLCLGLAFVLLGICLWHFNTPPIVFDKSRGMFLKGRTKSGQLPDPDNPKNMIDLDSVHALQLISKFVASKKSYYAHELNLVLKNGKRLTVLSHTYKSRIRQDAQELSGFLNIPVWDAIDEDTTSYNWKDLKLR